MQGELHRITLWLVGILAVLGALYYFLVHRFVKPKAQDGASGAYRGPLTAGAALVFDSREATLQSMEGRGLCSASCSRTFARWGRVCAS